MIISAIVASAKNRVIGSENKIPWYLPADLKYFKATTLGHVIIMGRKCFQSIGRPLPKRTNIVITKNPFFIVSGTVIARSVEEAIAMADKMGEEEAFIIGGGMIYEASAHLWDKIYFTEVDFEPHGDVFFPKLNMLEWSEEIISENAPDSKNEFAHTFKAYPRIKHSQAPV